jgi:hypothetical protein
VRFGLVLAAAGFAAVAASRVAMIYSPYFEEIQYERAPMGLEALAILRGETPVMNWSEPYHGTVFSYLLAPFYAFHLDPILAPLVGIGGRPRRARVLGARARLLPVL